MEEMSARMGALGERNLDVSDRQAARTLRSKRHGTGDLPLLCATLLRLVILGRDRCAGL
jgi:hypothetical protein